MAVFRSGVIGFVLPWQYNILVIGQKLGIWGGLDKFNNAGFGYPFC